MKSLVCALLFLSLAMFSYWIIKLIVDLKKRNFLGNFFDSFNTQYEARQIEKEAKLLYEGATEDKKFIDKIDDLLQRSWIRTVFPFLTSEILVIVTFIAAAFIGIVVSLITKFWLLGLAAFAFTIAAIIIALQIMSRITFNKIDKLQLGYINVLKNLSVSNDDIVTIFEKSIPYAEEPLKSYVVQFVFESKKGIALDKAFRNFEDKIENKRFNQLIKNLAIASKHDANYEKVFNASRIIFKHYSSEKERRRKAIATGRIGILLIVLLGAFIFKLLKSFTGDIYSTLKQTPLGNVILVYFLVVFIYTLYKFVSLDKLNY